MEVEPISVPPKAPPRIGKVYYYTSMLLFTLGTFLTLTAICLLQIPSTLIILGAYLVIPFASRNQTEPIKRWFYQRYWRYGSALKQVYGSWNTIALGCFTSGRLVFTGDAQDLAKYKESLIMANHQIYPEGFYYMQMLRKFGIEGGAKYIMMEYLKWFPILGTVMWLFDYLFIAQKLKLDKDKITENVKRYLKYYKDLGLSFLIFPEGTLNTPNNRITSRAYAKKVGLKEDPKYVILPKSTGIFMIADNLQPHINTLFDITIGYGGLTAQAIPYEEYLIENVFFSKRYPKEVHISVKRFQIDTLPGFDGKITAKNMPQVQATESEASVFDPLTNARKNAFNSWMRARFMEKDQELDYFYKNKRFPGETVATSEFSPNFSDFVIIAILWSTLWITIPLHVGVVKNAVSLLFGILK